MQVSETLDSVFVGTWWTWSPDSVNWFDPLYHWFNVVEGCFWIVFSLLVLRRHFAHRCSRLEVFYAAAFLAFAATDFREAWEQSSWLIWLKLLNLVVLLSLRRTVMSRYYPDAKVY